MAPRYLWVPEVSGGRQFGRVPESAVPPLLRLMASVLLRGRHMPRALTIGHWWRAALARTAICPLTDIAQRPRACVQGADGPEHALSTRER